MKLKRHHFEDHLRSDGGYLYVHYIYDGTCARGAEDALDAKELRAGGDKPRLHTTREG